MFILLIGSDARSNSYSIGLADAIRLVRVDFVEARVEILAFPRDLYVEIPDIDEHGITKGKLNQAFLYGNPGYGYFDGPGQGSGLLALALKHNFDVQTDHYVAVNLQIFTKIVDALGGIDIRLPYEVDGRVQGSKDPDRYFPAGGQHLNGYRTMLLARMRPKGDLERSGIQNLIINAVAEKLFSQAGLAQLPKLINTFQGSVQTDLGTREIIQLTCLAAMVGTQGIEYADFPAELFETDRVRDPVLGNTSILKADFSVLKKYVQIFEKGAWFDPGSKPVDEFTP
jgi:LCP family protein required for cell wall assembly